MISKKQYKLVPPDGGWAYMIWISAIINFMVTTMFIPSVGMIFNDLYIQLEMGSTEIQLQNGVNSICLAIAAFLCGPMMKVLSMRKICFLGGTTAFLGVFGTAFVNSKAMFILCQGILCGAGTGILFTVSCTTLNDFFLEKRFLMTSFAHAISAAAAIVAPLAIHWIAENHGNRATIIFIASVYLQTLVGAALQQPIRWHLKRVPIVPETEELMKANSARNCEIKTNVDSSTDINIDQIESSKHGVLAYIKDVFDWPFLKQFLRTCACVGAPLGLIADIMFTLFIPQALYAKNWEEGEVAKALSLLSFGDISTRILLIVASAWLKKVGNDIILITGFALDVVVKFVFLWFPNATVTYVTLTLSGCSRCIVTVLFSLVISDAVPPEKYGSAFGLFVLMYGVFGITLGPAVGAVRDATGNYALMFYLLNGLMTAVTLAWCVEIYCGKRKRLLKKSPPPSSCEEVHC